MNCGIDDSYGVYGEELLFQPKEINYRGYADNVESFLNVMI